MWKAFNKREAGAGMCFERKASCFWRMDWKAELIVARQSAGWPAVSPVKLERGTVKA